MKKKLIGIFIGILLTTGFIVQVQAIQRTGDEGGTTVPYHAYSTVVHTNSAIGGSSDQIIEILQNITEPLYFPYLENITAFGPRVTSTPSCRNAGTYLYDTFQSMGLEVRYQNWSNGGYQDRNIEATLHGTNETSDELYLIFGHFDTVANCPGADDDASGVATVLVAASLLSHYSFNHTIRFIAFSGEEQWMLGSHEYVEEAVQNGDNIVAVLNVDMIGFAPTPNDASKIKIYDNGAPGWVTDFTVDISEMYSDYIHLTAIPSGYADSDQTYFWDYGFDGIFYHEFNFNDYYHTPQDTIAHMNISYAIKCSRLSIATLAALAELVGNSPPETPDTPIGPTEGDTNIDYTFSTQTVDPNFDQIYYQWSWGNEIGEWIGPYTSGETVTITHRWTSNGTYDIKVKAKDSSEAISDWSEPLTITIHSKPFLEIGDITGGFGIHAKMKNSGDAEAMNVHWKITLKGFLFIGKEKTGTFAEMTPGSSQIVSTGLIFGIGPVAVTVNVTADELLPVEKQVSAFVLGPFVFRVR